MEIWVQMQVRSLLFIKSKANRQKQNNNQERDTPDGNVVLVSECKKPNVIGQITNTVIYNHAHVSAGRSNLGRQRDGAEVHKQSTHWEQLRVMSRCTGVWSEVMSGCTGVWREVMSPGGGALWRREGGRRAGLLTLTWRGLIVTRTC